MIECYKNERWLEINGTNGRYLISDFGRVKNTADGRLLKLYSIGYSEKKYQCVSLKFVDQKDCRLQYVHRLVAKHFIDNPDLLPEVNHKDGVKCNNHYLNLEWCTRSQNTIHAYKTGLIQRAKKQVDIEKNRKSKDDYGNCTLSQAQVLEIRKEYLSESTKQVALAHKYGVSVSTISLIVNRKRWKEL